MTVDFKLQLGQNATFINFPAVDLRTDCGITFASCGSPGCQLWLSKYMRWH